MQVGRRTLILASIAQMLGTGTAASAQTLQPGNAGSPPPKLKGWIRKGYANSSIGQMHYRYVDAVNESGKTPLVFFHPNPFSSLYFNYALEELGRDRRTIAFDTPGYGESARPSKPATIEEIAAVMAEALEDMGYGGERGKVDVTGFHTGAYTASELAAARPDLVRRVVLSGVPFWEGDELEEYRRELLVDKPLTEDGAHATYEWNRWVGRRNPLMSLERAYELFTSAVKSGRYIWWAYYGVIEYNARPRFPKIEAPVLLINPAGESLAGPTRAVLPLLANGTLLEVPELPHQIYDIAVEPMGKIYREFLDA